MARKEEYVWLTGKANASDPLQPAGGLSLGYQVAQYAAQGYVVTESGPMPHGWDFPLWAAMVRVTDV